MTDHYVDVVNEKDEITGRDLKSQKKIKGFLSRTVGIFILNSENKFLICKRAPHKKNDANLYDLSAYGNVIEGELYEEAAERELFEELGISCKLRFLDKYYQEVKNEDRMSKFFCGLFLGVSDKEPELNEELVEVQKMTFEELEREIKERPDIFCQGFKNDFVKVKYQLLDHLKS